MIRYFGSKKKKKKKKERKRKKENIFIEIFVFMSHSFQLKQRPYYLNDTSNV